MNQHLCRAIAGRRLLGALVLFLVLPGPAAAEDAVAALRRAVGAADAGTVLRIEAEGSNFSRDYNHLPGGPPQHLSDDRVETLWQPASGAFLRRVEREAWHPFEGSFAFSEAFDGRHASRAGPRDYRPGGEGALAAPEVGALHKRLLLGNPQMLLALAEGLSAVDRAGEPRILARAAGLDWTIEIDPETALPRSVRTEETHHLFGTVAARADYSDWRPVAGVMTPFRVVFLADGALERREVRRAVTLEADADPAGFRVAPAGAEIDDAGRRHGLAIAHMLNHRAAMTRPTELRADPPVTVDNLGDGVFLLGGVAHNSLVVEGARSLLLVEAPVDPARSAAIKAALARRFPGKPVEVLVLTHHHIDHSAGYAAFLRDGARLVVGEAGLAWYREAAARSGIEEAAILGMPGRATIPGFDREVETVEIPNSHAEGMIAVHVKDAGILFVTDLYSPGRSEQKPLYRAEFFAALRFEGFGPLRLVGGHGRGSEDWTPSD